MVKTVLLALVFLTACSQAVKIKSTEPYDPILKFSLRKSTDRDLPQKIEISLEDIQKNISESQFEVKNHPVYNKSIKYAGFYFKDVLDLIFKKVNAKNSPQYIYSIWSSDNFSAFIDQDDLKTGQAFLATREIFADPNSQNRSDDGRWTLVEKHGNPGPFYLVWDNPEKTYWQKWPFKIAEITIVSKDITRKFKKLNPGNDFVLTKGYRLVLKNCTSCHKVANIGFAEMGPDLKLLANARTVKDFLKQIRTPSGRMIAFPESALSDDDVKAIHSYLNF